MDHTAFVSRLDGFCDLQRDRQGLFDRDRTPGEALGQIFTFRELHDQEVDGSSGLIASLHWWMLTFRSAIARLDRQHPPAGRRLLVVPGLPERSLTLVLRSEASLRLARRCRRFDRVDRCDVRVIEGGEDLRFALETGQPLGIRGDRFGQHLDGHLTAELAVLGAIDLPHAAFAELGGDPEMRESLADQGARFYLTGRPVRRPCGCGLPTAAARACPTGRRTGGRFGADRTPAVWSSLPWSGVLQWRDPRRERPRPASRRPPRPRPPRRG